MKRMAMLILALMLTVLPVAALGEGESTVTVYGYGKTYVTLDTAVITFEISASAKTVQEARKQHDQKLEELYTTLESVGISKDQLQMSDSFLNTQYEFKFGKLERGVEQDEQSVGSEWKLTLPEKGMLEGTLDAILSANVVSVYTFTLESSGKQEAYQEALDLLSANREVMDQLAAHLIENPLKTMLIVETIFWKNSVATHLNEIASWWRSRVFEGKVGDLSGSFLREEQQAEDVLDNEGEVYTRVIRHYRVAPDNLSWNSVFWEEQ